MALADRLEQNASELQLLLVRETGKPRAEAWREVAGSVECLRWFAAEGQRAYGRLTATASAGTRSWVLSRPVGVVVAITPWNYPLNTLCRKIGPAFAAGCTMIAKPAPETPLSTIALGRLARECGFPDGVLNIVTTTKAPEIVGRWIADPRVRKIAFTGSTATGRQLFRAAAENFQRLSLELGGSAPALVFEDAGIEAAAETIVASRFRHAGQTCICAQRVLTHHTVAERLLDALERRVRALRTGNCELEDFDCGPLIHERAADRITSQVQDAIERGAVIRVGGKRLPLPAPNRGAFYAPTILTNVPGGAPILSEEVFGPVLTVSSFEDESDAIRMANSTSYGLAAYAFTKDAGVVFRVAENLIAGAIGINTGAIIAPQLPFGGIGASGMGRENGLEALAEYLDVKAVTLKI
jgi:succinate-semialdehyde dehydrogenase/glutarate-semialdehyde dehydrogenase